MIGRTVNQYRVVEKIGRGGMGEVFLAEDTSLQRKVALKFLPPALAESPESRERFLIEARAAAGLSHPNICVIHEVGEAEGRPFIAMEYVDGETLQRKVKNGALKTGEVWSEGGLSTPSEYGEGETPHQTPDPSREGSGDSDPNEGVLRPLETDEVAAILRQICAGLAEAHGKGIVHRDIKSSNIMITHQGQVKIMDFGLAKVQGGQDLTASNTTLGTVAYMSPEQAAGEEVDHRSDLWSTGVVLFEMLTGELPFAGDQHGVVLHHILRESPKPLTGRRPPVPKAFQRMVDKALKKKPDARYPTATDIIADLDAYLEDRRAEAAGAINLRWFLTRLRRPAVAIPVFLGLVAVASLGSWYAQRTADLRWAREEAIPEIRRFIQENDVWRNLVPAYDLAEEAEVILGDDPELADLFQYVSVDMTIRTEPSGANVSMKEYAAPEAEWTYLGVSPLDPVRVPLGILRWKFEKEGYETVYASGSSWGSGLKILPDGSTGKPPYTLVRTLDEEGTLPPGMTRVRATDTPAGLLPDFFIGLYEVTNREFKEFIDAGGYRTREYWRHPFVADGQEITWEEATASFVDESGLPGPSTWIGGDYPEGEDDHPVSGVSWYEAVAYAEFTGLSLPTDYHWDVGRGKFTPFVDTPQLGGFAVMAPFSNFFSQGTLPVGSLPGISVYGAYDMGGNVREWCFNESDAGRMIRGGAWEDNTYQWNRPGQAPAMDRSRRNGFRLAQYPNAEAIPEAVFGRLRVAPSVDVLSMEPVSDEVFQVFKEQFAYDPIDLNARVEDRRENPEGWTLEEVSYDAAYGGERINAFLLLPNNSAPPFQTVVYFPGAAAGYTQSSRDIENYYEFTMFLTFLMHSGRAVLFPVYKGTFERMSEAYPRAYAADDTHAYREIMIQMVQDARRSLDYLETREDIDAGGLAFYGMSWGGFMGPIITAVDDRFAASVLLAGGVLLRGRPEVHGRHYLPRVRTPTLMLNGKHDRLLDRRIQPAFDLLGTSPEHKDLFLAESDHIPPRADFIRETLRWLEKYLGPVRR